MTRTSHDVLEERPVPGVLLYRVSDVVRLLNVSRSVVFDLLREGRLRSVRQGRARLIPASALRAYVDLLIREAQDGA
jgi:excisionase family DNA binding protein